MRAKAVLILTALLAAGCGYQQGEPTPLPSGLALVIQDEFKRVLRDENGCLIVQRLNRDASWSTESVAC